MIGNWPARERKQPNISFSYTIVDNAYFDNPSLNRMLFQKILCKSRFSGRFTVIHKYFIVRHLWLLLPKNNEFFKIFAYFNFFLRNNLTL